LKILARSCVILKERRKVIFYPKREENAMTRYRAAIAGWIIGLACLGAVAAPVVLDHTQMNTTSNSFNYTVPAGTNRLVVVCVGVRVGRPLFDEDYCNITGITLNSQPMTEAARRVRTTGIVLAGNRFGTFQFFYPMGNSGSSQSVTISVSWQNTPSEEKTYDLFTLGNIDQNAPRGGSPKGSSNDGEGYSTTSGTVSDIPMDYMLVDSALHGWYASGTQLIAWSGQTSLTTTRQNQNRTVAAGYLYWGQSGGNINLQYQLINGNSDSWVHAAAAYKSRYRLLVAATTGGTAQIQGGGATGNYDYNATVTITAAPTSGYRFSHWSGDPVADANSPTTTISMNADNRSVTAHFIKTWNISVSASPVSGGTVSGGGIYDSGAGVTVNAVPSTGYRFDHWEENSSTVSTNPSYGFTAAADRNLVAVFVRQYTLNVTADPLAGGTVLGGGIYDEGTTVTVTAVASDPDYGFAGWYEGNTQVSGDTSYAFMLTSDRSLTARFVDILPPVITLNGPAQAEVECGETWMDPGWSASDNIDGDLTAQVVVTDPVNSAVPGEYLVTYHVSDATGNTASASRQVTVADTLPPQVVVSGPDPLHHKVLRPFAPPAATAVDQCEGVLPVVIQGSVDANVVGDYYLTYESVDGAANMGQFFLTVRVVADLPPDLTLNGAETVMLDCGNGYAEPGWNAVDEEDGDLTASVSVSGAPPAGPLGPGSWTVTYAVTDFAGNTVTAQRTVMVQENCSLAVSALGETALTAPPGGTVTFSVAVTGAVGDPAYQWERFQSTKAWEVIPGEVQPDLVLSDLQYEDAGVYRCVVSDLVTTVTSPEFTLTVDSGLPVSGLAGMAAVMAALAWIGLRATRRRTGFH